MKNTIEKILDDYSNELKYDDLYNLFKCLQPNDNHVNELMKRAYNQALEDVKEEERNNGEAIYDPKSFEEAVEPLMKWMSENQHPHTTAIVTNTRAELVEGIQCHLNHDFIVD